MDFVHDVLLESELFLFSVATLLHMPIGNKRNV
jgi:hypothetical protein